MKTSILTSLAALALVAVVGAATQWASKEKIAEPSPDAAALEKEILKMNPAADVAAYRGIIFGTNWSRIDDMGIVKDEWNAWNKYGWRGATRAYEIMSFGGVPLAMVQYLVVEENILGVRLNFLQTHYSAIFKICENRLGHCKNKNTACVEWHGSNLWVWLIRDYDVGLSSLEIVAYPKIKIYVENVMTEAQRDFQ